MHQIEPARDEWRQDRIAERRLHQRVEGGEAEIEILFQQVERAEGREVGEERRVRQQLNRIERHVQEGLADVQRQRGEVACGTGLILNDCILSSLWRGDGEIEALSDLTFQPARADLKEADICLGDWIESDVRQFNR